MNIFISGASGLLGGNCYNYFTSQNQNCLGTFFSYPVEGLEYFNTLDIENSQNADINKFAPDVIIHCGALTHVDYCETNEIESYEKTVQSTINLANLAKKLNSKFVLISTDYVFDGTQGPYTEEQPPNPLSIYGKHKLTAEEYVQKNLENYLIIRITNVYGNELRNKNFVARILEKCIQNEPLELLLPVDQYATPTLALDIARALFLLLENDKNGIYHLAGMEYINRVELAHEILKIFPNAKYKLEALYTKNMNQPAARPLMGGLIRKKFTDEFPLFIWTTVREYVQEFLIK